MNQDFSKYYLGPSDLPTWEYSNIFLANSVWFDRGLHKAVATFDLVIRDLPDKWSFYLFNGGDRLRDYVLNWKFDDDSLKLLKKFGLITNSELEDFYKNFRFSGDIYMPKDGTVIFPGEPIVRITAPLMEANLLTAFMLNVLNYPILSLSKSARIKIAAGETPFYVAGGVRLPGFEQGLIVARNGYLLNTSIAVAGFYKKFPECSPPKHLIANFYHSVIKSFADERAAYRYALDAVLPKFGEVITMPDTYDFKRGVEIFVEELKKTPRLKQEGVSLQVDSGDLYDGAVYARQKLDGEGFF